MTFSNEAIHVNIATKYLKQQSSPKKKQYAFAYHVTISNMGGFAAQLLTRHWIIIDGNQEREEVHGSGVIGQQPLIKPGMSYEYTSGVILKTPIGTMQGSYSMIDNNGETLNVSIEPFLLSVPNAVH
jgi:ApaG protein